MADIREIPLGKSNEAEETIKTLKRALAHAEAGNYVRVGIAMVSKGGAGIHTFRSRGDHTFALVGALHDLIHGLHMENTAYDVPEPPKEKA